MRKALAALGFATFLVATANSVPAAPADEPKATLPLLGPPNIGAQDWAAPSSVTTQSTTPVPENAAPPSQPRAQPPTAPAPPPAQTAVPPAQPAVPAAQQEKSRVDIPVEITEPIAKLAKELATVEEGIDPAADSDAVLSELRAKAQGIGAAATKAIEQLRPRQAAVGTQIEKLGAPPAKDAAPEAPAITEERRKLSELKSAIDGSLKTGDLVLERVSQAIDRIQVHQREQFARSLMRRHPTIVNPRRWAELSEAVVQVIASASRLLGTWWRSLLPQAFIVLGIGALIAANWFGMRMFVRKLAERHFAPAEKPPGFLARVAAATWYAPSLALPGIVTAGLAYLALDHLNLLTFGVERIAHALLLAIVIVSAVMALSTAALQPSRPAWRLFDIPDGSAKRMRRLIVLTAGAYALDNMLTEFNRALLAPLTLTIAQSQIASFLFAGFLIALLRIPFSRDARLSPAQSDAAVAATAEETQPAIDEPMPVAPAPYALYVSLHPLWLKPILWALALAIIVAGVLGYVSLARFLAGQIVLTGTIVVAMLLLSQAVRALASDVIDGARPIGRRLSLSFGIDEGRRKHLALALTVILNGLLLAAAAPLVLLQWGFAWADVQDWMRAVLFGFSVGGIQISLLRILIAVGILATGIVVTNLIKRSLDRTVLQPPRVDAGIAHSIRTAVGYAGIIASALLAAGYAGLSFTNLAIVAGALSVGIGFGLQSIVNNFVSGLILLAERPVKVGDWIVVGDREGIVRRISVRSTEIETFDRSSVIVPNSELITRAVTNWTHRNSIGRIVIKIGVSYDADPKRVCEILERIGKAHPGVLQYPAPLATFDNFGASSLDFSLNVFVSNIAQPANVRTDLRTSILNEFRAAGIEIPYPQQDIHLRDLDPLRESLLRAIAERKLQEALQEGVPPTPFTPAKRA